jgi:hypothetical protein
MKIFSTIEKKDYTINKYNANAVLNFEFVSASQGIAMTIPSDFSGSTNIITINKASRINNTFNYDLINIDTGYYHNSLHASIEHLFYTDDGFFFSGSVLTTSSLTPLADNVYVISIPQNLYGDKIKPGSFDLDINSLPTKVYDDTYGNLYVSSSGTGSYIGNIFYNKGIAVITENTASVGPSSSPNGIKLIANTGIKLNYESSLELEQHQINIRVGSGEYNHSIFNPSTKRELNVTGSVTQSFIQEGILPSNDGTWPIYKLMGSSLIKPYLTTIGLYNDQYELLAIAKLSTPTQRTFDTDQIFIIRFDLDNTVV